MRKARKPAKAPKMARRRRPLALVHRKGQFCAAHPAGFNDRLCDTFGTASLDFAQSCLASLMAALQPGMPPDTLATRTNGFLAAVDAVRPRDEMEAMLAVQMAGTHDLAMEAVGNVRRQEPGPDAQVATRLAVDLLQTYTLQVGALATLRRKDVRTVS